MQKKSPNIWNLPLLSQPFWVCLNIPNVQKKAQHSKKNKAFKKSRKFQKNANTKDSRQFKNKKQINKQKIPPKKKNEMEWSGTFWIFI
jgi:predicted RNA-binding protein YlxR (DUF448 family)